MATEPTPYVPRNPGDLITAGDWNDVQVDVKKDIATQIQTSIDNVKKGKVQAAGDADTLGGKTPQQLEDDITNRIFEKLPSRTGYRMLFKKLKVTDPPRIVEHNLSAPPLVDVYQLDYFPVVCSTGEGKENEELDVVNFYIYHASEKRLRTTYKTLGASINVSINIEDPDGQPFRIPLADLLDLFKVKIDDDTALDKVETDLWDAIFSDPNDKFDSDQYCHSPWSEKCCGERRTVGQLKKSKDWDDLFVKWQPGKRINYPGFTTEKGTTATLLPAPFATPATLLAPPYPSPAPTQIQVVHYDFDTLGIKLLADPVFPTINVFKAGTTDLQKVEFPPEFLHELKVMVLLKV